MWIATLCQGLAGCASGTEPSITTGFGPQLPSADDPGEADSGPDDDGPAATGWADDGADNSADNGPDDGPVTFDGCCQRHEAPGCQDPEVAECVCAADASCCSDGWTQACVEDGVARGCMACAAPDDDSGGANTGSDGAMDSPMDTGEDGTDVDTGGAATNACCDVSPQPGCNDAAVQNCVCAADSFCCDSEWDEMCVAAVDAENCGQCGGAPGGADDGGPPAGVCCAPQNTPGCSDPVVEACVCIEDIFCCALSWDPTCVSIMTELGCGTC
ncbi:MAG: hypothetical protein JKY37_07920 [Nannocystaceae bacterium]|nr:hypothetical protein [Nannocystaceae bacterium]